MKRFILFPLLLLFALACQNAGQPAAGESREESATSAAQDTLSALQQAYGRALAVHDQIMPQLAHLERLQRKLKSGLDALQNERQKEAWQATIDSLEAAYDGMMDWMGNFRPIESLQKDGLSEEEILKIYRRQEAEIREVGRKMEASRLRAEGLLGGR